MDPDVTLARLRALVVRDRQHGLDPYELDELVNLVDALDEWMTSGGFLPTDWKR